ncbi:MAG: MarR family transcriptional regulator [Eubacteriales bacterium]|nr:MarR family transcriptional regulator [Eubacteriales bacterium]
MDAFSAALNDLLVNTFNSILRLEEDSLRHLSGGKLSISEMHFLEAVGKGGQGGRSITDIARELAITLPSVTAAVNKLEKKGYLIKARNETDKRVVNVSLSREGQRAEAAHRFFHRQMVHGVSDGLEDGQRSALLKGLENLHAFFRNQERAQVVLPQFTREGQDS